jgi:hypothetical protein
MKDEELREEALGMMREAMDLSIAMEESLEGKDLYIILMALTKVAGVMLAEAKEIMPDHQDERAAVTWFSAGVLAAYRGHMLAMLEADKTMH